ncbi:MAG: Sec-independent protein translocase TatA [Alphaproteobacteria bacterium]|jgi:sec-independent protein translocase protein TatA|nr:Sec-independent protein translocase TatA [Alphaproteobacteria bacterium]
MAPGMWQIILVVLLALVLFGGRGKISSLMGDVAKGITSFRKGLKDEDKAEDETGEDRPQSVEQNPNRTAEPTVQEEKSSTRG